MQAAIRTTSAIAAALFATLLSGAAFAECTYPKSPDSAPNGSTATEAEMVAGMQSYKKYDAEVAAYLKCLDAESATRMAEAGENKELTAQIKAITSKKHNAAIDELTARAEEFNTQLRAYKAKQKK
jgi:hypothetical protein